MAIKPSFRTDAGIPPHASVHQGILVACQIALRYTHGEPTCRALMEEFNMSRATAYRWIAALRMAKGEHSRKEAA